MKKGSLWVCVVVLVFGLLMFFSVTGCQKKEAPTEQPAVTETAPAPEASATTGGAEAPAAEAPAAEAPAATGEAK